MMKIKFLLVLFIFFPYSLLCQNNSWFQLQTSTTQNLLNVYFIDTLQGWAVGNNGCIIHTTNGGTNWNNQTSPIASHLNKISFKDNLTGYAVGINNTIVKTTNGGVNWILKNVGSSSVTLNFLKIINDSIVYVSGGSNSYSTGYIFKTNNGGDNWNIIHSNYGTNFTTGQFFSIDSGIVLGVKYLNLPPYFCGPDFIPTKTENAGLNWTSMSLGNFVPKDLQFFDSYTGFVLGCRTTSYCIPLMMTIAYTTDRGNNWTFQNYSFAANQNAFDFVNRDTGYIVGTNGTLLKTVNRCQAFSPIEMYTDRNLNSIFFINSKVGFIAGDSGLILKTISGGEPVSVNSISEIVPQNYILYQNIPNPFNPSTIIKFSLPFASFVKLTLYNILGDEIAILVNNKLNAGTFEVPWNADKYPSAIYFYKLDVKGPKEFSQTKKMILIK